MRDEKELEMKVTTVRLPTALHRELAHRAIDEGLAPSEIIQKALRAYLEQSKKKSKS